jgi:hypothetical protein
MEREWDVTHDQGTHQRWMLRRQHHGDLPSQRVPVDDRWLTDHMPQEQRGIVCVMPQAVLTRHPT